MIDVGKKRQLMWDDTLVDKNENVEIRLHNPQRQNIAFVADAPWERVYFCYLSTVEAEGKIRVYYRAQALSLALTDEDEKYTKEQLKQLKNGVICVIESDDGINFTRPRIGKHEYFGSYDNNIVFMNDEYIDSFSVYYDENPDCPADEKFKALFFPYIDDKPLSLHYYKSSDGYNFEFVRVLDIYGAFDTLNTIHYDKELKKYRLFLRCFHMEDGSDFDVNDNVLRAKGYRDVRISESEDMIHWTTPKRLEYDDDEDNLQFYTNGVAKYPRADVLYGIPTRYNDRRDDIHNCKYLPNPNGVRDALMAREMRFGSAVTDCVFMHSYDGYFFRRSKEALISPGPENGNNWFYGDCYMAWRVAQTKSPYDGEPDELSLYAGVGKGGTGMMKMTRYTLRLDGFYSWYAKKSGGTVVTKPFTFDAQKLSVNFATSAFGSLRIKICDENGNPIDGYDSKYLFGDSVDRPVDFEKELSQLVGKKVRLEIYLSDCDLYSFVFE